MGQRVSAPPLSLLALGLVFLLTKEDKEDSQQGPCALILEPTRELALQVHKHLKSAARHTDIQVRKCHDVYCQIFAMMMLHACFPHFLVSKYKRLNNSHTYDY